MDKAIYTGDKEPEREFLTFAGEEGVCKKATTSALAGITADACVLGSANSELGRPRRSPNLVKWLQATGACCTSPFVRPRVLSMGLGCSYPDVPLSIVKVFSRNLSLTQVMAGKVRDRKLRHSQSSHGAAVLSLLPLAPP